MNEARHAVTGMHALERQLRRDAAAAPALPLIPPLPHPRPCCADPGPGMRCVLVWAQVLPVVVRALGGCERVVEGFSPKGGKEQHIEAPIH